MKDVINELYILRDLTRYNNTFKLKTESVAEHSYFVSAIVLELHKYYKFDLTKALIMAITHDISETRVTDVPHNVKRAFPKIRAAIKIEEPEIFKSIFPEHIELFEELERGESIESKIVSLADIISCVQYSNSEVKLGNVGYMKKVLDESKAREKELTVELKEHLR